MPVDTGTAARGLLRFPKLPAEPPKTTKGVSRVLTQLDVSLECEEQVGALRE